MSKINLMAKLISDEENLIIDTIGIKTKNKIIYKENNINVTILIFDNKIQMTRISKDYEINLILEKNKKTISTYNLIEISKIFELQTFTRDLKIEENEIIVVYELEGKTFNYHLKLGGYYGN